MKNLLDKYGWAIYSAVLIISLILVATPISYGVSRQIMAIVDDFTNVVNNHYDKTSSGHEVATLFNLDNYEATLSLDGSSDNSLYSYHVYGEEDGVWKECYEGLIDKTSNFTKTILLTNNGMPKSSNNDYLNDGSSYYVIIKNELNGNVIRTETLKVNQKSPTLDKKDIININGRKFQVLKVEDKIATLMDVNSYNKRFDFSSSKYKGSDIDTYLNETYYYSLPSEIQQAIVDTSITQAKYDSYDYSLISESKSFTRKVYLPSLIELEQTFDIRNDSSELMSGLDSIWTRDHDGWDVVVIDANEYENLYTLRAGEYNFLKPIFRIDLNKIEYTK